MTPFAIDSDGEVRSYIQMARALPPSLRAAGRPRSCGSLLVQRRACRQSCALQISAASRLGVTKGAAGRMEEGRGEPAGASDVDGRAPAAESGPKRRRTYGPTMPTAADVEGEEERAEERGGTEERGRAEERGGASNQEAGGESMAGKGEARECEAARLKRRGLSVRSDDCCVPPPRHAEAGRGGREEWMTVIPEARGTPADPLNVKARRFQRRAPHTSLHAGPPSRQPDRRDDEEGLAEAAASEAFVREYDRVHRGRSLASIYEEERGKEAAGGGAAAREKGGGRGSLAGGKGSLAGERRFDWERDMQGTVSRPTSKTLDSLEAHFGGDLKGRFTAGSGSKRFL